MISKHHVVCLHVVVNKLVAAEMETEIETETETEIEPKFPVRYGSVIVPSSKQCSFKNFDRNHAASTDAHP